VISSLRYGHPARWRLPREIAGTSGAGLITNEQPRVPPSLSWWKIAPANRMEGFGRPDGLRAAHRFRRHRARPIRLATQRQGRVRNPRVHALPFGLFSKSLTIPAAAERSLPGDRGGEHSANFGCTRRRTETAGPDGGAAVGLREFGEGDRSSGALAIFAAPSPIVGE
jgi:hypothetical protein